MPYCVAINQSREPIFEEFIVVPARKDQGFCVLELSVPDGTKAKYTGIFEESVKSLVPRIASN